MNNKKTTSLYRLNFLFIAMSLLIIFSMALFHFLVKKNENDGFLINRSGMQRYLSQKITKANILWKQSNKEQNDAKYIKIIEADLLQFKTNNESLLANPNSEIVENYLLEVQPYFNTIYQNSKKIIASKNEVLIKDILATEPVFLQKMNKIVLQYETENKERTSHLLYFITASNVLLILILLFMINKIIRPTIKQDIKSQKTIEAQNFELKEKNDEFLTINEELNSHIEELNSARETIENQYLSLQEASDNLRLYSLMIESSSDPVFMIDEESGKMIYVNNAAEFHFEASTNEICTWKLSDFDANFNSEYLDEQQKNSKGQGNITFETSHKTKTGKIIPVEISCNNIKYNGRDCRFGYIKNITERKRTEHQLQENERKYRSQSISLASLNRDLRNSVDQTKILNEHLANQNATLDNLNATKDKFFSIIAHDLKNPFNALLGFSDLLVTNALKYPPEQIQLFAENMYIAAQNGYKLLENLLDWSRLQSGIIEPNLVKVSPSKIIDEVTLQSDAVAKSKNIDLQTFIDCDDFVLADEEMIKTVLRNLISNALKFTNPHGRVNINTEEHENNVLFTVSDTGVGIDQKDLEILFRIDSKLSNPGTNGETGTGLGLMLCKEFIELNNGEIWAESELQKGSSIKFLLPKAINTHTIS